MDLTEKKQRVSAYQQGERKMKNINFRTLLTTCLLIFVSAGFSFAGDVDLSVKGGYFRYDEPGVDISYAGMITGLQGAYKKTFSGWSLKIQSEIMSGNLNYNGRLNSHQTVDGAALSSSDDNRSLTYGSNLWYSDSVVLVGRAFFKNQYHLTPYAGLGYRYLNNPDNPDVPYDYRRQVTYLYFPLVLEFEKVLSRKRSWGITAEVDLLLKGSAKANLSDASDGYNDLNFNQSLGGSVKLTGLYNREIGGHLVSLRPFVEMWMVDESDTDILEYEGARVMVRSADGHYGDYCEPTNITLAAGLQLNVMF
jgi:hypothetical protein